MGAAVDSGHGIFGIISILGLHVQKRLIIVVQSIFRGTNMFIFTTQAFKLQATLTDQAPIAQTRVKAA